MTNFLSNKIFTTDQLDKIFALILFIGLGIYSYYKCSFGIEFTDGGAYISSAYRLYLGDLPFRDELLMLYKPYDILLSFVFQLCPTISLFNLRLLNMYFGIFAYFILLLYLVSQKYPATIVAASCVVIFLFNNYIGIHEPGYNSMSCHFLLLSSCLWLFGENTTTTKQIRALCFFASGFFLALATICYSSLILLIFILIIYLLFDRKYYNNRCFLISIFVIGVALPMCVLIIYLWSKDLFNFWIEYNKLFKSSALNSVNTLPTVTILFLKKFVNFVPYASTVLFSVPLALIFKNHKSIILSFGLFWLILLAVIFGNQHYPLNVIVFIQFLIIWFLVFDFRKSSMDRTIFMSSTMWANSAIIYLYSTFYFNPIRSFQAALMGLPMLTVFIFTNSYQKARFATSGMLIGLILFGGYANYETVFRDSKPNQLTTYFEHPKLAGIRSTPDRVSTIQTLLAFLQDKLKKGDHFLAYDDLSILYYLTETRSSYGFTRAMRYPFSQKLLEFLVQKMLTEKRLPKYAVRTKVNIDELDWKNASRVDYSNYPLDKFVQNEYYKIMDIYPFEVFEKRK